MQWWSAALTGARVARDGAAPEMALQHADLPGGDWHLRSEAGLDRRHADLAADLRLRHRVPVADAHVGTVIAFGAADRATVLTSDRRDVRVLVGDRPTQIIAI